jgi:hypothetical protein
MNQNNMNTYIENLIYFHEKKYKHNNIYGLFNNNFNFNLIEIFSKS